MNKSNTGNKGAFALALEEDLREARGSEIIPHEKHGGDSRANTGSFGSNRASALIPGTTIPKRFYVTINIDLEKTLKEWSKKHHFTHETLKEEARSILITAEKRLQEYRKRWNIFRYYGCDVGDGFEIKYGMFWMTTDDGVIQLLREDFLAIGTRAIDAEMDYLDGKLEEVDGVLKPVKK